jgi:hypothetical protein
VAICLLVKGKESRPRIWSHFVGAAAVVFDKESIMNRHHILLCFVILLLFSSRASASVFGDVSGTVTVTAESGGFSKSSLALIVLSDRSTVLRVQLKIAPVSQRVEVRASSGHVGSDLP